MVKNINIGIIGMSDGNGHPYSWSAIFNGYDKKIMEKCEFPAIPIYLKKQKFPDVQIKNAKVTHIWTQDKYLSKKIASSTLIENVVDNYQDLVGNVDAIILARDDAENHISIASFFLKKSMPIFIDKPLALSVSDAKKILSLQSYDGQIFSCSSMRYSTELKLSNEQKKIVDITKNNNFINFYDNIDDIKTKPDIAIFCCSLCYLEDPYSVLKKVINIKPNFIAIDRTPFTEKKEDLFGIQIVNKKIYPARLPIITFSLNKFINFFKKEYILIEKWVAEEQPELSDNYKGFLFKKRY
jgi:hypothetical protein